MSPLRFFKRASDGSLILVSYHPALSGTWIWSLSIGRWEYHPRKLLSLDPDRRGQWHDYLALPFGWSLLLSRQDYHKGHRRHDR